MEDAELLEILGSRLDVPELKDRLRPGFVRLWVNQGLFPELPTSDEPPDLRRWRIAQSVASAFMVWFRCRIEVDVAAIRSYLGPVIESGGNLPRAMLINSQILATEWVLLCVKAFFGADLHEPATILAREREDHFFEFSLHPAQVEKDAEGSEQPFDSLFGLWGTQEGDFLG